MLSIAAASGKKMLRKQGSAAAVVAATCRCSRVVAARGLSLTTGARASPLIFLDPAASVSRQCPRVSTGPRHQTLSSMGFATTSKAQYQLGGTADKPVLAHSEIIVDTMNFLVFFTPVNVTSPPLILLVFEKLI